MTTALRSISPHAIKFARAFHPAEKFTPQLAAEMTVVWQRCMKHGGPSNTRERLVYRVYKEAAYKAGPLLHNLFGVGQPNRYIPMKHFAKFMGHQAYPIGGVLALAHLNRIVESSDDTLPRVIEETHHTATIDLSLEFKGIYWGHISERKVHLHTVDNLISSAIKLNTILGGVHIYQVQVREAHEIKEQLRGLLNLKESISYADFVKKFGNHDRAHEVLILGYTLGLLHVTTSKYPFFLYVKFQTEVISAHVNLILEDKDEVHSLP